MQYQFNVNVQLSWLRGPFGGELVVSPEGISLIPNLRLFGRASAASGDILEIIVDGPWRRGMRIKTRDGSMNKFVVAMWTRTGRRELDVALRECGYGSKMS